MGRIIGKERNYMYAQILIHNPGIIHGDYNAIVINLNRREKMIV